MSSDIRESCNTKFYKNIFLENTLISTNLVDVLKERFVVVRRDEILAFAQRIHEPIDAKVDGRHKVLLTADQLVQELSPMVVRQLLQN